LCAAQLIAGYVDVRNWLDPADGSRKHGWLMQRGARGRVYGFVPPFVLRKNLRAVLVRLSNAPDSVGVRSKDK
jgi:hypothetical protein